MKTATTNFIELINSGCPYHYIKMYLKDEVLEVSFKSLIALKTRNAIIKRTINTFFI